jgi:transglutaminase-like putative cysteine protease
MRLEVAWDTTYAYSEPVRVLHTELRVLPANRFGQKVTGARLMLDPDAHLSTAPDAFGNQVSHFDHLGSVDRIHIAMEATVETNGAAVEAPELTPLEHHLGLAATARCPAAPEIEAFLAALPEAPAVQLCASLVEMMATQFEFQAGHTDVTDTALGLLAKGRGVCQDFAHLMLCALRARGVPSRYVSGYLATGAGADATHAWVQAWYDGAWHGFDPANNCPQDGRYVVIAVGRDYDDVAPVRGSYRGSAEEAWHAVVRVEAEATQ